MTGGCSVGWAAGLARGYTVVVTTVNAVKAGYNVATGNATWWDALALLPVVGKGAGALARSLGLMKACFVEGTQVVVAMPIADGSLWTHVDAGPGLGEDEPSAGLDGLGCVLAVGAGLAGWRVDRRRRKRLAEAEERALLAELFGKGQTDANLTDPVDDETVNAIAGDRASEDEHDRAHAAALDELCETLFHGELAPAARHAVAENGRQPCDRPDGRETRRRRELRAVADDAARPPAVAAASCGLERGGTPQPGSASRGRAGQLWLAACLCVAAFFGWRFVDGATRPEQGSSRARPILAAASLDRRDDPAIAALTAGLPGHSGLPDGLGADLPAAPVGYRYVTKNIEDVLPDELVLAADPLTGEIALKPVAQTFVRTTEHLRILDFKTPDGAEQRFETTDEHPFYSLTAEDWVPAGDLEPGDQVVGPTGEIQHVAATRRDEHVEGVRVYNFEVADFHSYYVQARGARAPPVLVHNATGGICTLLRKFDGPIHHIATDKGAFSAKFETLFDKVGVSLQNPWNKMRLAGHVGPHGQFYHGIVLERFKEAIVSKTGAAARSAFIAELKRLRREIRHGGLDALLKAPASRVDVSGVF